MKKALKKRLAGDFHVPEKFIRNYRRYIILKCLLFAFNMVVMLSLSLYLSQFSGRSRNFTILPVMLISTYIVGYGLGYAADFRQDLCRKDRQYRVQTKLTENEQMGRLISH